MAVVKCILLVMSILVDEMLVFDEADELLYAVC